MFLGGALLRTGVHTWWSCVGGGVGCVNVSWGLFSGRAFYSGEYGLYGYPYWAGFLWMRRVRGYGRVGKRTLVVGVIGVSVLVSLEQYI